MFTSNIGSQITQSVNILRNGGIIAYPTDTLYGLGADPFSVSGVAKIVQVKGRSYTKGLPLLLADIEDMDHLVSVKPALAMRLAVAFWPGPLTLVLLAASRVPKAVLENDCTVALRVPDHPVPRALARGLGGPIIGTSANITGGPNPVTASDVLETLGEAVDYVLDGGPAYLGNPSTVVDFTGNYPKIIRAGALDSKSIEKVCGVHLGLLLSEEPNED